MKIRATCPSWMLPLHLLLLAYLVWSYVPMLHNGFVEDDFNWVSFSIQARGHALGWLTRISSYWNPVVHPTVAWDLYWHGTSPAGYLATNLMIHLLVSLLVSVLASEILGSRPLGFVVCVFWSTSALIVEPVVWLSARVHSLSALFMLLALLFQLRAIARRPILNGSASFIAFLLAIGAKETGVAILGPLVLVALLTPRASLRRRLLLPLPAVVVATVYVMIRLGQALPPMNAGWLGISKKLLYALDGYFLPGIRGTGERITVAGAFLFLALLLAGILWRDRAVLLGVSILVFPLGITLPRPLHASRYDYLPLVGATLMGVGVIRRLLASMRRRSAPLRYLLLTILVVQLPAQTMLLREEIRAWHLLGEASSRLVSRYRETLRALPCGQEILVINMTHNRVPALARKILEDAPPMLIQSRSRGIAGLVDPEALVTFSRYGTDRPCAMKRLRSAQRAGTAGPFPELILNFTDKAALLRRERLDPSLAMAVRQGKVRAFIGELVAMD